METEQAKFEGWAIVEMMGHQREIGFVTTQAFGQAVMFRIDTPELPEREFVLTTPEYVADAWTPSGAKVKRAASPARSRLVSPGALYAINPCTEETARTAIERTSQRPLILISSPARTLEAAQDRDFQCCSGNPERGHQFVFENIGVEVLAEKPTVERSETDLQTQAE